MTGLELAARCRACHITLRLLRERLETARERMTGTTAPLDKMPSGGGGDRFAAHAARVDELTSRIQGEQKRLNAEKKAVAALCGDMDERAAYCALHFYGEGQGAPKIARDSGAALRTVYHHLAQARSVLRQIPDAEALLPKWYRKEEGGNV